MIKQIALFGLAVSFLFSGPVRAETECEVPMVDWRPMADLKKMAREQGWTIERMRTDDGCYLLYATDSSGRALRAWIQPMTLEVLAEKHGNGRDSEEGDD